ncbi:RecQ4 SF II RNA helicase [Cryptosporidium canis]|nr:RecQ4 SF II RNA helicase [Cryptosporidium canis]
MSTGSKRTIRSVYSGGDLSESVLNLPLTPYSEQFLAYKQKLDKAISDLKLLVQEQISKDDCLDLSEVLEHIRSATSRDGSEGQKEIDDQIKLDKYFGVYLEIIGLEESRSDILECFIKWKNDHYYTRWEELSSPPPEMRVHWLKFKDQISKIILDSRKIGTRPLPRMVVSESRPTKGDSGAECDRADRREDEGSGSGSGSGPGPDNSVPGEEQSKEGDTRVGPRDGYVNGEEVAEEKGRGRGRRQKEKGSSGLWGPKTVPKSKSRYISGISAVRAIRKRTYSSNGRIRMGVEKDIGAGSAVEGEGKENWPGGGEEQVRNLRKWERLEEKRNEVKFKKYLLDKKALDLRGRESLKIEAADILGDPARWSSNFSQGFRVASVSSDRPEEVSDLFQRIRKEVDSILEGALSGSDLDTLGELCRSFLRGTFGYEDFREGQLEAIYSVLLGDAGGEAHRRGGILILPTGYGKSLCFQFLSLLINRWYRKVTLVVTPLISLMQDQLRSLGTNVRGAVWNSSVSVEEKKFMLGLIEQGGLDVLFVTPESMFSTFLTRGLVVSPTGDGGGAGSLDLSSNRIGLLCVDEAHCVCEWGHSFRPSYYSCIMRLVNDFRVERVLGITATAPSGMLDELRALLRVERVIQPYSNQKIQRENLHCRVLHLDSMRRKALEDFSRGRFSVTRVPKVYNNYSLIWDHIKYSVGGGCDRGTSPGAERARDGEEGAETQLPERRRTRREVWSKCKNILIYVWQRSEVEAVTNYLRTKGANALYYHGMMSMSEREMVQRSFIQNKTNIFVATTSFGMGIDKKDIDAVIHWNMPNSLEQYIQETGRCARQLDKLGVCLMLLSDEDYRNKRQIVSASLVDKTALRCLLHVILGRYRFGIGRVLVEGFGSTRVDLEIFPMEFFRTVLNVRQVEEIEALLHYLKPYLDYLLGVWYGGSGVRASWNGYIRGSPYLKIRCFEEDFSSIKEKSSFFSSISGFSTENSGVVTVNLLEASTCLGRTLEEVEEAIEAERSVWRISIERLTNKQCVIMGQTLVREGSQGVGLDESSLKRDFGALFLVPDLAESGSGTGKVKIRENWLDVLVEDLHRELVARNLDELWKLDIAYFSFQRFGMDKSCKDSILEAYFGDRRSELYRRLFGQELGSRPESASGEQQHGVLPSLESLEGVSKHFVEDLLRGSTGDDTFESMIQEIWIARWNQEQQQDFALGRRELAQLDSLVACSDRSQGAAPGPEGTSRQEQPEGREPRPDGLQRMASCIRSGVSCLLGTYLSHLSPVQWETYRISVERVLSHFSSNAQKESKRRRREEAPSEGDDSGPDFRQYLSFEEFDVIFPADIARILVGVTSFRYCYKAKGGLRRDGSDSSEIVSSKLWGKFKSIPYSVVLGICQESLREIIRSKLSLKTADQ